MDDNNFLPTPPQNPRLQLHMQPSAPSPIKHVSAAFVDDDITISLTTIQ